MTTKRTQAELHDDSRTVLYEFETLCETARNLGTPVVAQDRISRNAHIESFAIHSRALLAFFFGHDSDSGFRFRNTDVIAIHFMTEANQWTISWSRHNPLVDLAKEQADKHVAHITTHRRGLNQHGGPESRWPLGKIIEMFNGLMQDFLKSVPSSNLAPGVELQLHRLIADSRPTHAQPSPTKSASNPPRQINVTTVQQPVTDVRMIGQSLTGKTCPPDNNNQ